jgi:hypothetical protein
MNQRKRDPLAPWPPPPVFVELEDVQIIHRTERAVLINHDGEEFWIPLSQIEDSDDLEAGDSGCEIRVTEWFARKAKLI